MRREALSTADNSQEAAADQAIDGFVFPLDEQDEAKLQQQMNESWYNDNALLKIWDKIENSLLTSFRLGENTKLLKNLIKRDMRITGRSLAPFIAVGWLSPEDVKTVEHAQFWTNAVRKNRPNWFRVRDDIKNIDRTVAKRVVLEIPGSILTIPPFSERGEARLKELIDRADALLPKFRNIEKRMVRRDDIKRLYRATDPNLSMRDRGKQPYTPIPKSDFFQPIAV